MVAQLQYACVPMAEHQKMYKLKKSSFDIMEAEHQKMYKLKKS